MSGTVDAGLNGLPLDEMLQKRRALRRKMAAAEHLQPIRLAVLGGSTTNEVVDLTELYLLHHGFLPTIHQSEYGRFYEDGVYDTAALEEFKPDIVYVHTGVGNVQQFAPMGATEEELAEYVGREVGKFRELWKSLGERLGCLVIQNNFELPQYAILGNLDASLSAGHSRFVMELNREFAREAAGNGKLVLQDVCGISARLGLNQWFSAERWFSYKITTTPAGSQALAISLAALVRAPYGRTRKVLVLDLDDTLWGGVIGDDGVEKIQIGRETPVSEAYTAFQEYCLSLRNRGILLAVCSKNTEELAKTGFTHPDSVLKLEHFSSFKANWNPKHENVALIAQELNLGVDSFVFVDDNPAERALVEGRVTGIAVPDVGADVTQFARIIEEGRYFEQISFSKEDLERAALYQQNAQRASFEMNFADYGAYLDSLEMTAEIDAFKAVYLERMTQLTNKTNQFNLTTRRYTLAEMEAVLTDRTAVGIYGKLSDRFGENGLISIVLGRKRGDALEIELWLMSCRVLKRDMEVAMLDALVERARGLGVRTLVGRYLPTKKNGLVAEHYDKLGFVMDREAGEEAGAKTYRLELHGYRPANTHIRVLQESAAAQ